MASKSTICCKTHVLLYLMLMVAPAVYANHCSETYDLFACAYNMICTNVFDPMQSWSDYRRGLNHLADTDICSSESYMCNEQLMDPIYLTFKTFFNGIEQPETSLPSYYRSGRDLIDCIYSLELKLNDLIEIPTIKPMNNLVVLNVSYNMISTAKLSNANNIPSLKVIDFSHNVISNAEKYSQEHVYINLETINLSFNNLQQVPTSIFDSFHDLTNLDLSHNLIDTITPFTFEGMKKLAHLNMSDNKLSDINASLFRFTELQTLDLSNNNISHVKANDFNTLTHLTHLNLKCNLIKTIDKDTFVNLHLLQYLDMTDNQIVTLEKDMFKNVNISTVMISKNEIKTLTKSLFKGKNVEYFSIDQNKLEGSVERGMFEGLQLVLELDLSYQRLDSLENNAFYGLGNLKVLLLQNNNINILFPKCFNMLIYLKQLDLSYNKITNIEFEKDNLGNLESFSLRNNYLTVVKHEHFHGLDSLQFLDLSDNKISLIESNSFQSLKNLFTFEISNNPLNGTLEENTFEGLNSLPSLDISCTLITTIQNGSFNGMIQLIDLNISRSNIHTLQFNSFTHTGALATLDLSYNRITVFEVNNTQLSNLKNLYLNNNDIEVINAQTFENIQQLTTIVLSYNKIQNIDTFALENQSNLRKLDVSFNPSLMFDMSLIKNNTILRTLNLSGTKPGLSFGEVQNVPLSVIEISNASIVDVKMLKLNGSKHLVSLGLSNNNVSKVDVGCFTSISTLKTLDLSYNQITYIQPGAFKDNIMLHYLNISHNYLSTISYGIFRGVSNLNTIDISYNNIDTLQDERFYEVKSLSVLVVDHNRIKTFNRDFFLGTNLKVLSIGDNPIPCESLVAFAQNPATFRITAIKLEENDHENVNGVACNKYKGASYRSSDVIPYPADDKNSSAILMNIRDILLNKLTTNSNPDVVTIKDELFANISNQIVKSAEDNKQILINLTRLSSEIVTSNQNQLLNLTEQTSQGNTLLENILQLMINNSIKRLTTPAPITKDNATYDNLVIYIHKLKEQLEDTIAYEKNKILNDIDIKLSANNKEVQPINEKLSASQAPPPDSKSIFTETCVGLILLILVCFVLYKIYKSGMFVRRSLSISTRQLPDAMDSAL